MKPWLRKVAFYALLLGLWQVLCASGIWPPYAFPGPLAVWQSLWRGFADGVFQIAILVSLKRLAMGFGISVIVGTSLGFAIGRFRMLEETLGSLVLGLQTLPSVCWLPLALLWFGLNDKAIIFVTVMGAVLSITTSTVSGVKGIPPIYLRAGRNLGAGGLKLLVHVVLPSALPSILVGLRQGWSFAWRSLLAGELLFVSMGLGQLLMMGRELNDMSQVLAVMAVLIALGTVFDRLVFGKLEQAVAERWGLRA